jgi:carboxymethylenebutenolidase
LSDFKTEIYYIGSTAFRGKPRRVIEGQAGAANPIVASNSSFLSASSSIVTTAAGEEVHMSGEMVNFQSNGSETSAYLSSPSGGKGPGVVVIQEWWGLVPHIKDIADRFAKAGFLALAPDLYHGKSTKSPDEAGKLMMAMNIDRAEKDLSGAVSFLMKHRQNSTNKVGTVGFCMGGALSLYAATKNTNVKACVVFYGGHPNVHPDLPGLQCPVLGLYAEKDTFVSDAVVRDLDQKLTALGKPHEFHTYPGVAHGFFNNVRPEVFDKVAAEDAWSRTVGFFRKHLS